ncbi:MAG: addiction module protein [Phaeodactylibacter sp.]|nr:addiction module protein [Phaeodactylibacter sp.]
MTIQSLKEEVQKLSKLERILFVQFILDTISQEVEVEEEGPLSGEWVDELEARRKAYMSGASETFTWEEVKKQLPNAS